MSLSERVGSVESRGASGSPRRLHPPPAPRARTTSCRTRSSTPDWATPSSGPAAAPLRLCRSAQSSRFPAWSVAWGTAVPCTRGARRVGWEDVNATRQSGLPAPWPAPADVCHRMKHKRQRDSHKDATCVVAWAARPYAGKKRKGTIVGLHETMHLLFGHSMFEGILFKRASSIGPNWNRHGKRPFHPQD